MNYSKHRSLILDALKINTNHPTAEEIYMFLKKDYPKLSLATVYRNLNYLSQLCLVKRIKGLGNSDHFDYQTHSHSHFLCQSCGKIHDLPETIAPDINKSVEQILEAKVVYHDMSFIGVCSDCQKHHKVQF